ncbi:phytanoyl-CoA dioxygenase family protein [Stagnihabitans tardus]|uniref:Phytanoyl-CoA dioxygenase family protein n=1 Tax=Stagnihabitans tardus TaxID=2699202 RepID=A0AAE4YHC6_9RHOB|nr:phytanoyl-CoA dioxygenase family protein [Stagnihabitans tardus]NBZ89805.1 phytanoyl-CoA dioxygenase family protein [Stagnihabitans tardus]
MTETATIPEYLLSREQIDSYRRNGVIRLEGVIPPDVLDVLRGAVEQAVEAETHSPVPVGLPTDSRPAYEKIFNQKVNLWQRHPEVARFTLSSALGSIAARLEGRAMRIWHDQALFKEPMKGNNKTPWHQDAVYWPHADRWHQTTVWIALKDATTQNGCMAFVEGTQSLGPLPPVDLADPQDLFDAAPHLRPVKPVPLPLKAGSVTFHNGLTFHYAGPNKSDDIREAFAIIYMPEDTVFDGSPHVVTDGHGFQPGQKLEAELFPLVS